jgi:hypothetical protein
MKPIIRKRSTTSISTKDEKGIEMNSMKKSPTNKKSLRQSARIIWAIVAKDLLEALKNKNTLAIILITLPMILVYYYLPI